MFVLSVVDIDVQELMSRMSGFQVRSHWILISVLVVIGGALMYDIQKSGSVASMWLCLYIIILLL